MIIPTPSQPYEEPPVLSVEDDVDPILTPVIHEKKLVDDMDPIPTPVTHLRNNLLMMWMLMYPTSCNT